jgi:4-amino-4-deoxy-L-arabinose transferase-like glycosyltransferase
MCEAVSRSASDRASLPRGALFAALSLTLVLAMFAWIGPEQQVNLESSRIVSTGGHMFAYELSKLEATADSNVDPFRSSLEILEDGRRLGPAHSMHADIMQAGAGRFSHFSQFLYFSASDNSNAAANGRTYSIRYRSRLHPAWPAAFALVTFVLTFLSASATAGGHSSVAPRHFRTALREARAPGLVLFAAFLALLHLLAQLLIAPDMAAQDLDLLRRGIRSIVALSIAAIGGAAIWHGAVSAAPRTPWPRALGQLVFLLLLGGALSANQRVFAAWVIVGAGLAYGVQRFPRLRAFFVTVATRTAQDFQDAPRRAVWRVCVLSLGLTFINIIPEMTEFWDESGWMDSRFYDMMAHDIARGATPFGNSEYAPLYQYAMGALYWSFGHFYFVQQIVNIGLACVTTLCFCWTAWLLFGSLRAVVAAGLFAAYWAPLHHAVWYTQIENLYIPLFAASVLALAFYFARPTRPAAALLSLAAALVFSTRQQSAFYVTVLALTFVVVPGVKMPERLRHLTLYVVVFVALGVLPWSLRNWEQENRFTPSSRQSTAFLAIFNDPRIPFHAIRYWERADEVRADWAQRYPDPNERDEAMRRYFHDRLLNDTGYFIAAAPWRLGVFYGLLPGAYVGPDWSAGRVISFRADWLPHLIEKYDLWIPVVVSLLALLAAWRSRTAWLLLILVGSNVVVGLLVGSAEPRNCYPVLLLHAALAIALVVPFKSESRAPSDGGNSRSKGVGLMTVKVALAAALVLVTMRLTLGAQHQYRTLPDVRYALRQDLRIDDSLPLVVHTGAKLQVDGKEVTELETGKRYRARFVVTAYVFPPRYIKGLSGLDPSLAFPHSIQYYSAFLSRWDQTAPLKRAPTLEMPLRYDGAIASTPLREQQIIDAEFRVEAMADAPWASLRAHWSVVEKAVVVAEPGR